MNDLKMCSQVSQDVLTIITITIITNIVQPEAAITMYQKNSKNPTKKKTIADYKHLC